MSDRRTIMWWSTGAASAIAARLLLREVPEAIIARCETNNEDEDNYRFEADVMRWLNRSVTILKPEALQRVRDEVELQREVRDMESRQVAADIEMLLVLHERVHGQ